MCFGEEAYRGKVSLSSHPIKGTYYQDDLLLLMLTLITRLWCCVLGFSTVRLLFSPLFIVYSLGESYHMQSALKEWEVTFHLLQGGVSVHII